MEWGQKGRNFRVKPDHVLVEQFPFQFNTLGNWVNLFVAGLDPLVQVFITGKRSCGGVLPTAKSEEEGDHIFWAALLSLSHVDSNSRFDKFFSV